MNLFQRALVAIRAIPPPQPVTWENLFPARYVSSGIDVSEYTALNYSPVWSGVSTLSRDVAKLPLVLYKNLPNGGKERFTTHPLYRILKDEPNREMTSFKFRETMQALCLLYGNAYAEIVRDALNRPAGMYPIVPTRVAAIRDRDSGRLFYRVTNHNGGQVDIPPANMIHLSSLSTDGIIGHGIVEHAKESIGLGIAAEKFGGSYYGNGTVFGGIVEIPVPLTAQNSEIANNTRSAIEAVHQGVERAHKLLVLGAGTKFTPRGTTPNESQFTESRKFQVTEVARWLNMPAHKLGDLENAHFTNIEEQELQYYQGCVSGWLEMWEQELSRKLIAPLEYSQQSIEHVMEGVLRGSSAQRADFYTKLFNIGAISINRILQLENMNPIGPSGDVHLVPLNMIPLERYGEWIDAEIEAKKPQPQLPADNSKPGAEAAQRALQAIEDSRAALATLFEQERSEQRALAERVTAKLDDEIRESTEKATAAIQAQTEAEARADANRLAKEQAEQEAATLREAVSVAQAEARSASEACEQAKAQVLAAERTVLETAAKATTEAQRAETTAQERATLVSQVEDATRQLTQREEALAQAQRDQAAAVAFTEALQGRLETATATIEQLEASTRSQRENELDRLTRVVAAHRALIVDVSQRLLKPELDRARRHQVSPENLRKWADAFYQTHREVCADALYPVVLTHLAWKRSDEDPRTVAQTLAAEHCEESQRQLRMVMDGSDPEEFHAVLERTLMRWEQERPGQLADKVLYEQLAFIRSF